MAVFIRYFQERLLARLAESQYCERFILKGGLFLFAQAIVQQQPLARPTRDVDLGAKGIPNTLDSVRGAFTEICQVEIRDGVAFDYAGMKVEPINTQKDELGVRVRLPTSLAGIKSYIQIDIGFGDVITPAPEPMIFPVLLEDMSVPRILAYSIETAVAEKFQAMMELSISNSRFRDFYGVYYLARGHAFSGERLSAAVRNTFRAPQTPFRPDPIVFWEIYITDANLTSGWATFVRTSRLPGVPGTFAKVMATLSDFLQPIYLACALDELLTGVWLPEQQSWVRP